MPAKILVIEDNPANLELMVYLLSAFGYRTCTATDGQQGVASALRDRPDLAICDIQLPELDGYGVIRRLRAEPDCADMPVVAVTAFAMVGDQDRILAAGFDGCLAKPIDPERFVEQIEAYLDKRGRKCRPVDSKPSPSAPGPENSGSGTAILVVDDRADNLQLARSLLEPFGYEVITALGRREGLMLALERPPALILSDVCMGDGNGYDFIRDVKGTPQLAAVPFIFLTSTLIGDDHRKKGLALGADRYLFRPIEPELLLKEVRNCLASRALLSDDGMALRAGNPT